MDTGLAARGRAAEIVVGHGLAGVCENARDGDLVLLDPFDVHAAGGGYTAWEAFAELAARGVHVALWYPIHHAAADDDWLAQVSAGNWTIRIVGDDSLGGLAGCGFVAAHLPTSTTDVVTSIMRDLARTLAHLRPGLRIE